MKINEVLQEKNIGTKFKFRINKEESFNEDYILLKKNGQVELFNVENKEYEESKIEDEYYLKVILEGDFEIVDEYGDFEE